MKVERQKNEKEYMELQIQLKQLKEKGIMIDNVMPNDDDLVRMIQSYDNNKDGSISREEMKEFILNTLKVGWVSKPQK